jgi:hypothetical protein
MRQIHRQTDWKDVKKTERKDNENRKRSLKKENRRIKKKRKIFE